MALTNLTTTERDELNKRSPLDQTHSTGTRLYDLEQGDFTGDVTPAGRLQSGGTTQGKMRLLEASANGSNYVDMDAPASLTANRTITVPDADVNLGHIANPLLTTVDTIAVNDLDAAATNGNDVYVAVSTTGVPYLACNNAGGTADSFFTTVGLDAVLVAHNASPSGLLFSAQMFFDEDATVGARMLHANSNLGNVWVRTVRGYLFKVTYSATAATDGVALQFDDDGADSGADRLLFVSPTDTDGVWTSDDERAANVVRS